MNILSLFDGISCGQLALQRAGIKYENYYASEIDKYAIAVTQHHFPNTHQLGNIKKWRDWDLPQIDMIIGGSPCQGFSMAGKKLNFDDPRSALFFEFVNILKHYNPQYFLLENVKMKKEWENIITEYMEVQPILIDSALVSAQSRKRLYWTNIPGTTQPADKGLLLRNIIESGNTDREKAYALKKSYRPSLKKYLFKCMDQIKFHGFDSRVSKKRILKNVRGIDEKGKSLVRNTQNPAQSGTTIIFNSNDFSWRKLTPLECERLQTMPDNYALVKCPHFKNKMLSDSRRYMLIGNAWTVDVIAHIFNNLKGVYNE